MISGLPARRFDHFIYDTRMRPICLGAAIWLCTACGDNVSELSNYYPQLPDPTGAAPTAFAGQVTDASQLVTGPAQSGLVGDYFLKNAQATFIVQAATRVLGVIPQGGNLVDATLNDGSTVDQFGELALMYVLGRTCEPDRIEVVRDGSGGGVAVLRAIGKTANDDYLNIKGIGLFSIPLAIDPTVEDHALCATTYVLEPGSPVLAVYHSLYNAGSDEIDGPIGTIADSGGTTEQWSNAFGFERADIRVISSLGTPHPSDYTVFQGPGVAYGVIPRHADANMHVVAASIAGVSIVLDNNDSLLDILNPEKYALRLAPKAGVLQRYDVVVAHDVSAIDTYWRERTRGEKEQTITGKVTFADGLAAVGARVGVFLDGNANGVIDSATTDLDGDGKPDDPVLTYFDVAPDGTYQGKVPSAGNLIVRAEVKNVGRSAPAPFAATTNLTIPAPLKVDFQILDHATGLPIPGRLVVIGDHPAFPDQRVFETYDRAEGIVTQEHAIRGTSTDLGDGADEPLLLPAGAYRIYASRGTEWSIASAAVSATGTYTFELDHVVPTPGYYATDWHVHQINSPDSPVPSDERVRSAVSAGVEMFAVTDHDYISNLQPIVEQLHLERLLRVVSGVETTPFAFGHINAWPLVPDLTSANGGAVDWARGAALGQSMTPGEIYAALKARGAQMVQVNHPRASGVSEFQSLFSRANLKFDYDQRTIFGDYQNADVPNDYLRLPEENLWSDNFTGLEIWNGFATSDSNGDGLRENQSLDVIMHDWLSMLSLGLYVTPAGDSDTHTITTNPLGMPRTYVRVADDSADALADGTAVDEVVMTQTGAMSAPRDVIVTDGPMLDVTVGGLPALGRVISSNGVAATIDVKIYAAEWAAFDTLEVFANSTPDGATAHPDTELQPLKCWTSRDLSMLNAKDPCKVAVIAPEAMVVTLVTLPGGGKRFEATVHVTLDAQDIATRAGATGKDAWLVFRARGDVGIFPILTTDDAVSDATMPALLGGDFTAIRAALTGKGVQAQAVTAPVFLDFDGGGYRAPFAP